MGFRVRVRVRVRVRIRVKVRIRGKFKIEVRGVESVLGSGLVGWLSATHTQAWQGRQACGSMGVEGT